MSEINVRKRLIAWPSVPACTPVKLFISQGLRRWVTAVTLSLKRSGLRGLPVMSICLDLGFATVSARVLTVGVATLYEAVKGRH